MGGFGILQSLRLDQVRLLHFLINGKLSVSAHLAFLAEISLINHIFSGLNETFCTILNAAVIIQTRAEFAMKFPLAS